VYLNVLEDVILLGEEAAVVSFGAAYEIDQSMWAFAAEGILGLGFNGLSRVTDPPFFDVVAAQVGFAGVARVLTERFRYHSRNWNVQDSEMLAMFSFYLARDTDPASRPSTMILGGYDLERCGTIEQCECNVKLSECCHASDLLHLGQSCCCHQC
jgi:hypothetical protein